MLTTIPYIKCIAAYEKLTSAYDMFHILAKYHHHVSLCNPLVVSEPYFLQALCIQEGQPDVPYHGGCHHDVDVCIGGVRRHASQPGKETKGARQSLLPQVLWGNFSSLYFSLQFLFSVPVMPICLSNAAFEQVEEEFMAVANSLKKDPPNMHISTIIREANTSPEAPKETIPILRYWK